MQGRQPLGFLHLNDDRGIPGQTTEAAGDDRAEALGSGIEATRPEKQETPGALGQPSFKFYRTMSTRYVVSAAKLDLARALRPPRHLIVRERRPGAAAVPH